MVTIDFNGFAAKTFEKVISEPIKKLGVVLTRGVFQKMPFVEYDNNFNWDHYEYESCQISYGRNSFFNYVPKDMEIAVTHNFVQIYIPKLEEIILIPQSEIHSVRYLNVKKRRMSSPGYNTGNGGYKSIEKEW